MGGRWLLQCLTRRVKDIEVAAAAITTRATFHTLRHSCATHMLGAGHDIGTTPELLGHSDVSTTMHCTHVLNRDERGFGDRWALWAPVIGYCGGSCRTGDGGRTIPCRLIDRGLLPIEWVNL